MIRFSSYYSAKLVLFEFRILRYSRVLNNQGVVIIGGWKIDGRGGWNKLGRGRTMSGIENGKHIVVK